MTNFCEWKKNKLLFFFHPKQNMTKLKHFPTSKRIEIHNQKRMSNVSAGRVLARNLLQVAEIHQALNFWNLTQFSYKDTMESKFLS